MTAYELKQATSSDYEFLKRVHHLTLRPHVERIWGWNDSSQDEFFKEDFESGQIQVIRSFDQNVGYLHLNTDEGFLNIANILILPEFQNRKLGSTIIKDLIAESKNTNQKLRLGVFKVNIHAKRLYDFLGFKTTGENETHFIMEFKLT